MERGMGDGPSERGQGNLVWELAEESEKERVPWQADHVSHHVRAVEFPLFCVCGGEACEDKVGLRLVGDE